MGCLKNPSGRWLSLMVTVRSLTVTSVTITSLKAMSLPMKGLFKIHSCCCCCSSLCCCCWCSGSALCGCCWDVAAKSEGNHCVSWYSSPLSSSLSDNWSTNFGVDKYSSNREDSADSSSTDRSTWKIGKDGFQIRLFEGDQNSKKIRHGGRNIRNNSRSRLSWC